MCLLHVLALQGQNENIKSTTRHQKKEEPVKEPSKEENGAPDKKEVTPEKKKKKKKKVNAEGSAKLVSACVLACSYLKHPCGLKRRCGQWQANRNQTGRVLTWKYVCVRVACARVQTDVSSYAQMVENFMKKQQSGLAQQNTPMKASTPSAMPADAAASR